MKAFEVDTITENSQGNIFHEADSRRVLINNILFSKIETQVIFETQQLFLLIVVGKCLWKRVLTFFF